MCGVFADISSNSSSSRSTPASSASASRCRTAFVDPPIAACTVMAFSKAGRVRISSGCTSDSRALTASSPHSAAADRRSLVSAAGDAEPNGAIPIASAIVAIVFAVAISAQEPAPGHADFSSSRNSASVISLEELFRLLRRFRHRLPLHPGSVLSVWNHRTVTRWVYSTGHQPSASREVLVTSRDRYERIEPFAESNKFDRVGDQLSRY